MKIKSTIFSLVLLSCSSKFEISAENSISLNNSNSECFVDGKYHLPHRIWTPGKLCSASSPDFTEYRYPAHIAYCGRNVSEETKIKVAERYGYTKTDLPKLEIDHWYPLSMGGSNSEDNLFAQPIDEAREKDKIEEYVYHNLKNNKMTQDEAVKMIDNWKPIICK